MRFYLIFFLFLSASSTAQKFGNIYVGAARHSIQEHFEKQLAEGKKKQTISFSQKRSTPDSLNYTVNNEVECINMNFGFQKDSICNYQEYEFNCSACAKKHMHEMIRTYKLRRKSAIEYISPWHHQVVMIENHNGGVEEHLLLSFRKLELPKKEYKALYRKLK